jgi:colanic acid biosynthesis glycosyl transferase WcaI
MKLNIISQYYWPEDFAAGIYLKDLAIELKKRKHDVRVLTSFPNYPQGKIFTEYKGKVFMKEEDEGIKIYRSYIKPISRHLPIVLRSLSYISFSVSVFFNYLFQKKPHITYVLFPIIPLAITTLLVSKLKRVPIVFGVKDISILGLIKSGKITNKLLIIILRKFEILVYSKADLIQVPSNLQFKYLTENGINPNKIILIPDWANPENTKPLSKINSFSEKLNLTSKFIIIYSGNIGYSSDLLPILDVAAGLSSYTEILFLIIGDGVLKEGLVNHKEKLNLDNLIFLDFQPIEVFPEVLATADLSIITLNKSFTHVATQGKIYNIMSSGRPILAIMDKAATAAEMIEKEEFGRVFDRDQISEIKDFIISMYNDRSIGLMMGHNARRCLIENFTLDIAVNKFENAFLNLLSPDSKEN